MLPLNSYGRVEAVEDQTLTVYRNDEAQMSSLETPHHGMNELSPLLELRSSESTKRARNPSTWVTDCIHAS
jgi:hypothetical protein